MRLKKTINNVYECAPNAHTRTYLKTSMKNLLTLLLFVSGFGIGAMAGSSSDVYFEADFEKGIPRDFTVLDRDENPSKVGVSNIDLTGGSWTTAYYAKGHRAAMSSAYCTYDYGVDDWLILPQINVKDYEAILTWEAMSVHYDFREDYKVMISESGTKPSDFVEVYSVTAEDYYARRHAISLEQYYGKDIYVAFVHTGCDKFLLAIDNIKVGVWENEYMLINNTDMSHKGGDDIVVRGFLRNLSSTHFYAPVLIVDGVEYPAFEEDEVIPPVLYDAGQDVPFDFTVPTPEEGVMKYTIAVKGNSGAIMWSVTDSVYCSAFPRNMLVEKLTGTWCNNCPEGSITMHKFEERLRNRIIMIEGHIAIQSEPMYNPYVQAGLLYWSSNLPSIVFNRLTKSQSAQDDGTMEETMRKPVTAEVVPTVKFTADGRFEVTTTVRFAQEYDNSLDRYRIAYMLTENAVHMPGNSDYAQSNNCQSMSYREYNFLPSTIPSDLMVYHNVARGDSTSYEGKPLSLPNETLLPGVEYQVVDTIDMPATPIFDNDYQYDPLNMSVNVMLIYTRNKSAVAAARVHSDDIDWSNGINNRFEDARMLRVIANDGRVSVLDVDGRAQVRLYDINGRILSQAHGVDNVTLEAGNYRGVAIVAVETANDTMFEKIIIK